MKKQYRYKISFYIDNKINNKTITLPVLYSIEKVIHQFEEDYYRDYGKIIEVFDVKELD